MVEIERKELFTVIRWTIIYNRSRDKSKCGKPRINIYWKCPLFQSLGLEFQPRRLVNIFTKHGREYTNGGERFLCKSDNTFSRRRVFLVVNLYSYSFLEWLFVLVFSGLMVVINMNDAFSPKDLFLLSTDVMYEETLSFRVFLASGVKSMLSQSALSMHGDVKTLNSFP